MSKQEQINKILSDPVVIEAKKTIGVMKKRGFDVFFNPSSMLLISDNPAVAPTSKDMDHVYSMHHEIGLLYAIHSFKTHFKAESQTASVLKQINGVNASS